MEKKKNWFRRHKILTSILGFFMFLIIIGAINSDPSNLETSEETETIKENLPTSYEEAKQKAVSVSYEDLMRYSESYIGKWICFKGQVIQVVSDIPKLELRVSTKKEDLGGYWDSEPLYYDNVVYLYSKDYSGERLLEEDIIQFCGKSLGILNYEAILGNPMSIPRIETDELYIKRES